jgi:GNAT superfamily N-acetyltransferase
MTGTLIRPVRGRGDVTAFIRMAYDVYRGDPRWVPPLERERRAFLDRRANPFFEFGEVELFLARRDGRVVGRVAAVHDPRHNEFHGRRDGFFGLFECADDLGVAEALLDAAAAWLRGRGLDTLMGPVSFSTNNECGLLVEGFDSAPAVLMPYNPPYYPGLLESCGLVKAKDLWAWEAPAQPPERVERVAAWVRGREEITVRPADLANPDAELALLKDFYTAIWAPNWGFVPMTDRELRHMYDTLRRVVKPEGMLFCEVRGEPVGVAVGLPDFNQALRAAGGRLATLGVPLGLIRLSREARRIRRWRLAILGVRAGCRGLGLETLLVSELCRAARRYGCEGWEGSWTLEDNDAVNRMCAAMGAERSKTYRIYRRPL